MWEFQWYESTYSNALTCTFIALQSVSNMSPFRFWISLKFLSVLYFSEFLWIESIDRAKWLQIPEMYKQNEVKYIVIRVTIYPYTMPMLRSYNQMVYHCHMIAESNGTLSGYGSSHVDESRLPVTMKKKCFE